MSTLCKGHVVTRDEFYVYVHADKSGNIFYVGKGTGRRAWSTDRYDTWHRYVKERLSGRYTVRIFKDHLTEGEAEELESELISQYGAQLVNWINPGRVFDYKALDRLHRLQDANRQFIVDTKVIEETYPETAIERYRKSISAMATRR